MLSDLYPLLRTVEPAELNMMLNAMATALEGRGDQIGENLETVDDYLKRFNPQIPALVEDLRLTAQVSDIYAEVLPQIGTILHNTVTTTSTLEDRSARLNALLNDVTDFSGTARTFLDDNGDNMIRLGDVSRAQLRVLARYSTEFPCLLGGIVNAGRLQAEAFRGFTLHIVLETLPHQPRAYTPNDTPRLGDDRGPACLHLPNPPWSSKTRSGANPTSTTASTSRSARAPSAPATSYDATTQLGGFGGYAGSPEESDLLATLLAPGLGTTAAEVPDLGGLLLGPMVRGATVSLGDPDGGVTP